MLCQCESHPAQRTHSTLSKKYCVACVQYTEYTIQSVLSVQCTEYIAVHTILSVLSAIADDSSALRVEVGWLLLQPAHRFHQEPECTLHCSGLFWTAQIYLAEKQLASIQVLINTQLHSAQ